MVITHMHASASLSRATPLCGRGTDKDLVVDEPERTNCLPCRLLLLAQEWDGRGYAMYESCAEEVRTLLDSLADVPEPKVPEWRQREQDQMRRLVEADRRENVCRCPILRVGDFCPVHGG